MNPSVATLIREVAPEPWLAWLLAALVREVRAQRYDDGLTIDPYLFAHRIASARDPDVVERRARELLPGTDLVVHALSVLRARGALWHPDSTHVFRIPKTLEALALANDGDVTTAADWAELDEDGDPDAYVDFLRAAVPSAPSALRVLAILLPARELDELVTSVSALVDHLDPIAHHPHTAQAVLSYLLARNLRREDCIRVVERFASIDVVPGYIGNPMLGRFAAIALEHDLPRPLTLFIVRRALRSNVPLSRREAAAALAKRGEDWCADEIEAASRTP